MTIFLRVADITDDAIVTSADRDRALVILSSRLRPGQRVAIAHFLSDEVDRRRQQLAFRIPSGAVDEQALSLGSAELVELMRNPDLSLTDWERLIDLYVKGAERWPASSEGHSRTEK